MNLCELMSFLIFIMLINILYTDRQSMITCLRKIFYPHSTSSRDNSKLNGNKKSLQIPNSNNTLSVTKISRGIKKILVVKFFKLS